GANASCVMGSCVSAPPANDSRANAQVISLTAPTFTTTVNISGATNSVPRAWCASPACTTTPREVFYTFTLTQPEIVYADTFGTGFDTLLWLQDATGAIVPTPTADSGISCSDNACGLAGGQSQLAAVLDGAPTGTRYYLLVSNCTSAVGTVTLHFSHLPR